MQKLSLLHELFEQKKYFKNIKLSTIDFELDEPRSDDIQEIAKSKVIQAYEMVKKPCIALDTDFRIDEVIARRTWNGNHHDYT